jgi:ATP/maltotriose-dependent transcriptional regulator MalT
MPTSILATKLYLPRLRPNVVSRPRLLERLNAGLHRKLTLIAAPAGFGKTTLVSEWVEGIERPIAWLSLDEGENDPTRFLAYLVTALQTIAATLGEGVLGVLQSSQPPPPEAILTALLNEITTLPDQFVLVLDDYHVIDAKPVDLALTFLVEHLPPQMHLVIATREDPLLPLARLRARGELTELRAADLRFTPSEAAEFLNSVMGLNLSPGNIAALEDRTEGWIAGLQLAALSMRGREDIPEFIRAFTGDHRYILDYLVEEVLTRQPEPVRSFLLQTAILDRLSGSLCDAVTGQEKGNVRLEALEHGNFFVVALDDTRHWYRYHHLFAEVLSAHLLAEQPEQVSALHRRASAWYEQHGSAADAIRHALAAQDFARAADLVELAIPEMRRSRQEATVLGWLTALPDELIHVRPVLSVGYAGALLVSGEFEGVEARVQDAERWLDTTADRSVSSASAPSAEMVVVDEAEFRRLPGTIALYRAAQAQALGDVANTMKYARRVLDLVLLHEAERLYVGDFFPYVRPVPALVTRVWVAQGRLGEALGWAREQGLSVSDEPYYLREFEHITLARVLLARSTSNRADRSLHEAVGLLERLLQAAEEGERTGSVIEILVLQALAHQMQGDIPAALVPLQQALTLAEPEGYVRMFVDEGPPMALLLEAAAKHGIAPNYVRHLLTAFGSAEDRPPVKQGLIEPLSERELEVLRLLATGLNGPEIARELVVSLNTMRTHTKNIYSKLGVNDRRAAVRRAKELDLFS